MRSRDIIMLGNSYYKIVKRMLGQFKINYGIDRILINSDLDDNLKTITFIKSRRIAWFEHFDENKIL